MNIGHNIDNIKKLIFEAELAAHRVPGSVLLLAVSKQQSVEAISKAFHLGLNDFGENYYQEALAKMNQLKHLPIHWHFIGPIQSNKTKGIALHFDWVHSVNRIKVANQLNEYRPEDSEHLNVCLQVNLIEEKTKSGTTIAGVRDLAKMVSQLPKLKLRGLMTIPPPLINEEKQYHLLLQLNNLMQEINNELNLEMDTLSMGMSEDLVPAIKAGATIVRIGRAIFGERAGGTNEH
jgi:pyridoxal phosphate enzyme (YggS family)